MGLLGIISILAIQAYMFYKNYNISQKEFDQQVHIALLRVAKNLSKYNNSELPSNDLIKKISPSYFVVNINDRIDANVLEFYLHKAFQELSLIVDFEYAIYDCATDIMLYGDYCSKDEKSKVHIGDTLLPKYEEFIYYFGVRFPKRKLQFFGDPSTVMLMGAILLLTLFLFGYSLYIIIKQQRIASTQREFINNMTHEFKTPLSSIKIAAEAIMTDASVKENPRLNKYTQIIRNQNDRLEQQVMRVLEMARLEKSGLSLERQNTDVIQLVKESVDSYRRICNKDTKISFQTDFKKLIISLDRFHFTNVLNNLLDNARYYNTGKKRIDIRLERQGKNILLSISDNGIGIKKEELGRIFDKYYRVSTGNVHNVKGFGLGLYYVKQVVKGHKWDIDIKSKYQHGTTVVIKMYNIL